MHRVSPLLLLLLAGAAPTALAAQTLAPAARAAGQAGAQAATQDEPQAETQGGAPATTPRDDAEDEEAGEILVTGQRPPGSVIGNVPAEVQFTPADIRSYGVSTVTDLLTELSAQTTSGRGSGPPVVLLNGRRISGFGEIRDLPTEAILRVDILPEEVALKYGYRPDQKVVNFVLRRRFNAITTEATGTTSTEGGGSSGRAEASLLRINPAGRLSVALDYRNSAALRESQRDIVPATTRAPFAFAGNVTATTDGAEIDPALSAIAGQTVTIAGVPAAAAAGPATLAQFAANANIANATDVRRYRTLRPATDQLDVNAVLSRTVFGDIPLTLNASFGATGSEGLRGLPGASLLVPATNPFSPFANPVALFRYVEGQRPLSQSVAGETAHAGITMNGDIGRWRWNFTGNYDRALTRTVTQTGIDVSQLQARIDAGGTLNPFGPLDSSLIAPVTPDRARALSNSGDLGVVVNGTAFALPAGDVSASVRLGAAARSLDTRSIRSGVERSADLSRRSVNGQVNFDLPITSRRNDVLAAIGDLSANVNLAAERLSDFGTLTTLGYGLTWKPRDGISLIWSVIEDENAPTIQQLGNPQIATSGVRLFDYLRGTTVDITRIDGGNPALRAETRHVTKLGLNLRPLEKPDLTITANYVRTRTRDQIASLPSPTAAIEAAFPDRFLRDADGTLLRIDDRPVNFAEENREQLRWGFNLSVPLKPSQRMIEAMRAARERRQAEAAARGTPAGAAGANPNPTADSARGAGRGERAPGGGERGAGGPGAGGGPGGFGGRGGGFGGRGGGGPGGRVQLALYHTWVFRDDVLIRPGLPVLDQLNGAAAGANGGQPRHALDAQAGFTRNGIGARFNANWQSGTIVRGGTASSLGDLRFASLTTANLRLFADAGQMPAFVGKSWARGLRVSFGVNNLFNQRLRVRDATGATPLGYQPFYIDPIGREVRLSIRKLFF